MARKDAIELEGTVVELLPNTMFRVEIPGRRRVLAQSPAKCVCISFGSCQETKLCYRFHLTICRKGELFIAKNDSPAAGRGFDFANYESTTISKETLCELQDCEAQERIARDLQKPAAQATPGLNGFNFVTL